MRLDFICILAHCATVLHVYMAFDRKRFLREQNRPRTNRLMRFSSATQGTMTRRSTILISLELMHEIYGRYDES